MGLIAQWKPSDFFEGMSEKRVSELVTSLDVTSTILDETKLPPGPDMRGRPLSPMLAGRSPAREHVIAEDGAYLMVRSRTRKLLYFVNQPSRSLLFDLEKDPLELDNRFASPEVQSDVQSLKEAMIHWLAVESRTTPHLNLEAREIHQPNVPNDRAAAEREMENYINAQMKKVLEKK